MRNVIKLIFIVGLISACNNQKDPPPSDSFYFELEIFDSIQVNLDEQLNSIDFGYDKGVAYGYMTRAIVVFDSTGRILAKKNFPEECPGSVGYIIDVRIFENGDCFIYSFGNQLTLPESSKCMRTMPAGQMKLRYPQKSRQSPVSQI